MSSDREVQRFDRAETSERDWRALATPPELERLLAGAGLVPLDWARVFDLGPLPLIQAVIRTAPGLSTVP